VLGLPAHFSRLDRRSSAGKRGKSSVLGDPRLKVNKNKKKGEGRKIDERMHEVSEERGHPNFFLLFLSLFSRFQP
jgi:hypothetical protein